MTVDRATLAWRLANELTCQCRYPLPRHSGVYNGATCKACRKAIYCGDVVALIDSVLARAAAQVGSHRPPGDGEGPPEPQPAERTA